MPVSRPSSFSPYVRWPLIAIVAVSLIILLAWLVMPLLVRHVAIGQIEQQLGRKASLGEVIFNPFTLTLTAREFVLYEADGSTPAMTLAGLLVDTQASSLFRLAPVVREVRLEKPSIHLVRLSGNSGERGSARHNFSDILERLDARPKTDQAGAHFSIANIQLSEGSLHFDDRVTGKQVRIDTLATGVPFISNFDNAIDTFVEPSLSGNLNGTHFALKGRSKPFSGNRETALALDIDGLDVAQLAALLPVALPLKIDSARLSTRLNLDFIIRNTKPEVTLSGHAELADLALSDLKSAPLLKTRSISTTITKLDLLSGDTALTALQIQAPEIWAALDEKGMLNWSLSGARKTAPGTVPPGRANRAVAASGNASSSATATAAATAPSTAVPSGGTDTGTASSASSSLASSSSASSATTAASATAAGPAGTAASTPPAAQARPAAAKFKLASFSVQAGVLHWRDAANASPPLSQRLDDIRIDGAQLSLAPDAPPASLRISTGSKGTQQISFTGQVQPLSARVAGRAEIGALALAAYQPYLNGTLSAALSGRLDAATLLVFENGRLRLNRLAASVDDFRLQANGKSDGAVGAKRIVLENAALDTGSRRFHAGSLSVSALAGDVSRKADGTLNLQRFFRPSDAGTAAVSRPAPASATTNPGARPASAPTSAPPAAPWLATLDRFVLNKSALTLSDESMDPPVQLRFADLGLSADNLSSAMDRPVKLALSGNAEGGRLAISGTLAARMAALELEIDAQNLPFTLLQPYYGKGLNIRFAGGTASTKGQLSMVLPARDRPLAMKYKGSARIADFRSLSKSTSADFLKWKTLDLGGISAEIGAGRPQVSLDTVTLADFYMRAVLSAEGKLNLRDIVASGQPQTPVSASPSATAQEQKPVKQERKGEATVALSPTTAEASAQEDDGPIVKVGRIDIRAGNINFTDNFVKPNYTVNMTGMNGSIGAIASNLPQPASIELAGKIDNAAPVTISGSLNPLFKPMFLDIKASANGIELPRLTPYATKYAGYPIEKGKLSMDVTYRIEQQKLTAQNSVRIDQLTFGERVDSPTATSLPVLLAVKLLKDRNGQIEINLPVSGSLDDPQFSIGGLIGRVLLNLLAKALTSPFALIASAFGGGHGEDLGFAEFVPGTSTLTPAVQAKLDTLARAMQDRPALRLDIIGRADRATDTDGARLQQLNRSMRMMKLKDSLDRGQNTQPEDVVLSEAERIDYLEKIYKAANFEKPKNALGLARSVPPEQMQALILSNTEVSDDNLRSLAGRRATVVRRYLENTGKVALERMFLIAPKLGSAGSDDKEAPNRVEFKLN